jgi:hypothetical protein
MRQITRPPKESLPDAGRIQDQRQGPAIALETQSRLWRLIRHAEDQCRHKAERAQHGTDCVRVSMVVYEGVAEPGNIIGPRRRKGCCRGPFVIHAD